MRTGLLIVAAVVPLLAACGSTDEERAATGGLTGAGVGALAGGPIGAVVGAVAGGAGGAVLDKGVDERAQTLIKEDTPLEDRFSGGSGNTARSGDAMRVAATERMSAEEVRNVQEMLRREGLYDGPIDGIVGPKTRHALFEFAGRNATEASGSTSPAAARRGGSSDAERPTASSAVSEQSVREELRQQGYSQIAGIRRDGGSFWAQAQRSGSIYNIEVSAETGRIASVQEAGVSANSSTPPSRGETAEQKRQ